MKLAKILLSTLGGATLAFAFSACSRSAAVGNSPTNTIAPSNAANATKANAPTVNNAAPQSNAADDKKSVTQVSTQEKQELFQLIKKDKEVGEFLRDFPKEADKLIQSLTVRKMDLNSDNQNEYVAVLEQDILCGTHANCPHWIYGKKGDEYSLLRQTRAQAMTLEKTATSGYRDLRAAGSDSAATNSYVIYKFDGNKYQPDQCVSRDESGKTPKETRINCKDMGEEIQ